MTRDFVFLGKEGRRLYARGAFFACADAPLTPLEGFTARPGIIDLHGDCFERHVAPRRGVLKDLTEGLVALDAELASSGITTAILPQFFSWQGGVRSPWFAEKLIENLAAIKGELRTDMQIQLRIETCMIEGFEHAERLIEKGRLNYVVFNDNLPYEMLQSDQMSPRLLRQALRFGMEPRTYFAKLKKLAECRDDIPAALAEFATRLCQKGVLLGYHDEKNPEARDFHNSLGIRVSEFPQSLETAKAAFTAGCPVILGAPNIMRGRSHNKALKAVSAVRAGYCSALVSDYHYPSLRLAALKLLPQLGGGAAWALISSAAARCLGLNDRGRLEAGQRADLTILDERLRIAGTMCAGSWSFLTHELATRL